MSDIRYLREYFDDLDLNGNGTGAPLWEQRAALHPVGTESPLRTLAPHLGNVVL